MSAVFGIMHFRAASTAESATGRTGAVSRAAERLRLRGITCESSALTAARISPSSSAHGSMRFVMTPT